MANEKIMNTRIRLKYDLLSNWTSKNPTLLEGELAIAYLGNSHTSTSPDNGTHPVLFKVGPGKFNDLPFASALAADVYAWAKKENLALIDLPDIPVVDNETGKFVTDVEWDSTNNQIVIHRANVVAADIADAPWLLPANESKDFGVVTADSGKVEADAIHDNFNINGSGVISTAANGDTITISADLSNYATKSEIPTDLGVMSVTGENAIEATPTTGDVKVSLLLDNSGNVTLTQTNNGLKADVDTGVHAVSLASGTNKGTLKLTIDGTSNDNIAVTGLGSAAFEEATAFDTAGAAAAVLGEDGDSSDKKTVYGAIALANEKISSISNADESIEIDSGLVTDTINAPLIKVKISENEDNVLELVDDGLMVAKPAEYSIKKADNSGEFAAIYQLTKNGAVIGDAINIPKDMVVESGTVETKAEAGAWGEAGTYIELKLQNVEEPLYINVGDLIEYVTSGSTTGDMVVVAVSDDHKVTATITDGTITKAKLEAGVQTSLGKADTAIQPVDIGTMAKETATDYVKKSEATGYADILTKTAAEGLYQAKGEYATAAQGEKADAALPTETFNNTITNYYTKNEADSTFMDANEVNTAISTALNGNNAIKVDKASKADEAAKVTHALTFVINSEDPTGEGNQVFDGSEDITINLESIINTSTETQEGLESLNELLNYTDFTVSGTNSLTGSGSLQLGLSTNINLDIADKGVTTAKIADKAVGAEQTKAYAETAGAASEEVWVFYCGTASILAD